MVLTNNLGPIYLFYSHLCDFFFPEPSSNVRGQNKACPFTSVHFSRIFSFRKVPKNSVHQTFTVHELHEPDKAVLGSAKEETNRSVFLLPSRLVVRLTSKSMIPILSEKLSNRSVCMKEGP